MSDKELSEKIRYGLHLAEMRMLQEKALRDECVVTVDSNNRIVRIPAKQIIANNPVFQK